MILKKFFGVLSIVVILTTLIVYLAPINKISFSHFPENSNFSLNNSDETMQFYQNMRFPANSISYKIQNCSLQKENDMTYAFEILENLTSLKFNPVFQNEQISISCEEKTKYNGDLFIAGEGGPVNVSISGKWAIISKGEILLLRSSSCAKPNIAIHELLHVLGFKHSSNPSNIMYNLTECDQIISEDIISEINQLYSSPSYPDLAFENVSAEIKGRFLNINFSVLNEGLTQAKKSNVSIYVDDKLVEEDELNEICAGCGNSLTISNIFISKINQESITLEIITEEKEISKENNKINLARKE